MISHFPSSVLRVKLRIITIIHSRIRFDLNINNYNATLFSFFHFFPFCSFIYRHYSPRVSIQSTYVTHCITISFYFFFLSLSFLCFTIILLLAHLVFLGDPICFHVFANGKKRRGVSFTARIIENHIGELAKNPFHLSLRDDCLLRPLFD